MSYHVNRRWGDTDDNPSVQQMTEGLAELDVEDIEHPDVALIHESGWCLGAYPSGLLVWENLESGEPSHMCGVSRDRVLELWQRLSRGELAEIESEPWKAGYGKTQKPNHAASGNGAQASLFHTEHLGRAPQP